MDFATNFEGFRLGINFGRSIKHDLSLETREVVRQVPMIEVQVVEKIVEGRLEKYYQENCLLEQAFVKNPDQTIDELITELTAKIGEKISVRRFERFVLGGNE